MQRPRCACQYEPGKTGLHRSFQSQRLLLLTLFTRPLIMRYHVQQVFTQLLLAQMIQMTVIIEIEPHAGIFQVIHKWDRIQYFNPLVIPKPLFKLLIQRVAYFTSPEF